MNTANDVYSNAVATLPAAEQLRLASLILQGLTKASNGTAEYSDEWSDQDIADLAAFASKYAVSQIEKE
jgi:cytochrome c553